MRPESMVAMGEAYALLEQTQSLLLRIELLQVALLCLDQPVEDLGILRSLRFGRRCRGLQGLKGRREGIGDTESAVDGGIAIPWTGFEQSSRRLVCEVEEGNTIK